MQVSLKHREYVGARTTTTHVCMCGEPASNVDGFYTFNNRRVRVWSCDKHYSGNPLRELGLPTDLVAALQAEAEHLAERERYYRFHRAEDGSEHARSVKYMAPSGHGDPIPGDRIAAWRWGA